jgi:hypothetical protein
MVKKLILTLVVIASLGLVAFLYAEVTANDESNQLSPDKAVGFLRTVGSAEATYKAKNGKFASLQELIQAQYLLLADGSVKDDNSGTLKNYNVSIVASADGQHFHASMIDHSACEGSALFVDDTYVIFTGKPIGCHEPAK